VELLVFLVVSASEINTSGIALLLSGGSLSADSHRAAAVPVAGGLLMSNVGVGTDNGGEDDRFLDILRKFRGVTFDEVVGTVADIDLDVRE